MSAQADKETSTWQHTTITRDRQTDRPLWFWRDSDQKSHEARGGSITPDTVRPLVSIRAPLSLQNNAIFYCKQVSLCPKYGLDWYDKEKSLIQPGLELRNLQGVGIYYTNYAIPISVILVHVKILCMLVLPVGPAHQFNSKHKVVSAGLMSNIFA